MKAEFKDVELQLLGKVLRSGCQLAETDKPSISRHKAATAPNVIHSLDASAYSTWLRYDSDAPYFPHTRLGLYVVLLTCLLYHPFP